MAKKVVQTSKPESTTILNELDFGLHIKYKRTSLAISKQELADLCNVNYQTIDNIESGKKGTRLSSALYVSNMLGIEIKCLND